VQTILARNDARTADEMVARPSRTSTTTASGCTENVWKDGRELHMTDDDLLSLFYGRCGHQWVGASDGSFACPICGDHDGDHHLIEVVAISVQQDDWGSAWERLSRASRRKWKESHSALAH
jgi:hypothetical protein